MSSVGFNADEYFKSIENKKRAFQFLTKMTSDDLEDYKRLLSNFEELNKKTKTQKAAQENGSSSYDKGKSLEELVTFLLEKTGLFEVHTNIRTHTNEIDQLLELSFQGQHFLEHLPFKDPYYLSECKNYNKKIDVTWVGKFYSLLNTSRTRYGIIFSYHGLTGENWGYATGLTKKIFLLKEKVEERFFILDFNITDFKKIAEGVTFLQLLESKIKSLIFDTDFEQFLKEKHPAEM